MFGQQPIYSAADYNRGYQEGFRAGIEYASQQGLTPESNTIEPAPKKRKVSAYNRRYKAAFKKVAKKYKLKSGKWKAGGFRRAVKEAHRIAGGKKR